MRWSPYADNGGTCLSVAGDDYCVLVADTRLSTGYRIHTRNCSKVSQLTDKCVIGSCGMKADAITLHKMLKARIGMYERVPYTTSGSGSALVMSVLDCQIGALNQ